MMACKSLKFWKNGRGSKIRTCDPLLPKQVRYQAALCPDSAGIVDKKLPSDTEEAGHWLMLLRTSSVVRCLRLAISLRYVLLR